MSILGWPLVPRSHLAGSTVPQTFADASTHFSTLFSRQGKCAYLFHIQSEPSSMYFGGGVDG
jgi:hypothetical protein